LGDRCKLQIIVTEKCAKFVVAMGKSVTLVPYGGIGNRISAIESAVRLCGRLGASLRVVWLRDWGMKALFGDLFADIPGIDVVGPSFWNLIAEDWPRKRNLFVPAPFQGIRYDRCFYGDKRYISLDDIKGARKIYIASCYGFFEGEEDYSIFSPSKCVSERVSVITEGFAGRTVGIHVRRMDNIQSIEKSPTSLFLSRMAAEPQDTVFYLASDSEDVKREILDAFPGRVITNVLTLRRGSLESELEAAAEMFALSRCDKIIGSFQSTFGLRSAAIGHKPFEIC